MAIDPTKKPAIQEQVTTIKPQTTPKVKSSEETAKSTPLFGQGASTQSPLTTSNASPFVADTPLKATGTSIATTPTLDNTSVFATGAPLQAASNPVAKSKTPQTSDTSLFATGTPLQAAGTSETQAGEAKQAQGSQVNMDQLIGLLPSSEQDKIKNLPPDQQMAAIQKYFSQSNPDNTLNSLGQTGSNAPANNNYAGVPISSTSGAAPAEKSASSGGGIDFGSIFKNVPDGLKMIKDMFKSDDEKLVEKNQQVLNEGKEALGQADTVGNAADDLLNNIKNGSKNDKIKQGEKMLTDSKQKNGELTPKIQQSESKIKDLDTKSAKIDNDMSGLNTKKSDLQSKLSSTDDDDEKSSIQSQIKEIETQIQSKTNEKESLKSQKEQETANLNDIKNQLAEANKKSQDGTKLVEEGQKELKEGKNSNSSTASSNSVKTPEEAPKN